jgi:hypothetical protein
MYKYIITFLKNMNKFYVYQLRDPRSELPFYIGKGFGRRAWHHIRNIDYTHKSNTIQKILREGYEVQVEILQDNLTEESAFELEIQLISKYGRRDLGTGCLTNLTAGGEGVVGRVISEKEREGRKIRQTAAMAKPEVRERHKAACKAAMQRPETKARVSASSKGRIVSDETRELNRVNSTGENNPMFGRRGNSSPITGRRNVHHPETLELKLVDSGEVDSYIQNGWRLGRIPGTATRSSTGRKSVYNPVSKEVKMISETQIDEYLASGWIIGRFPKGESKIANRVGVFDPTSHVVKFIPRSELQSYIDEGWKLGRREKPQLYA